MPLVVPMECKVLNHLTAMLLLILEVAPQIPDMTCTVAPTPLHQLQVSHILMVKRDLAATGVPMSTAIPLEVMLDATSFITTTTDTTISILVVMATLAYTHAILLTVGEALKPSILDCTMKDSPVRPKFYVTRVSIVCILIISSSSFYLVTEF